MKAMLLHRTLSLKTNCEPLTLADVPIPEPKAGEILIEVSACGVCHTDLDIIEGRTPPSFLPIIPGHQVVGRVVASNAKPQKFKIGDRVGVGWIFSSTGDSSENIADTFKATGRDANGGYAEFMCVSEDYAYKIPDVFSDIEAAPLLCAGAVGYRALKLVANFKDGNALGLMGFGGSNHLVLQLARHLYPHSSIFVFARDATERAFALELGAAWAGDVAEAPPQKLDAVIDTTPAWKPVVEALTHLKPGGRLVINAIRKQDSDKEYLLNLCYEKHLWMEKEIKSVANVTHFDLEDFLPVAAQIPLKPHVQTYALGEANKALVDLKCGSIRGAKVLRACCPTRP
ncbi:MAG: zinc-dependent alcohol dehydrogenase family protein [Deltaproteobacteria bacterium]|nr:zinc-dependent alcohol dehydrogenase family protein [Deltaproteobacteria bacterium]